MEPRYGPLLPCCTVIRQIGPYDITRHATRPHVDADDCFFVFGPNMPAPNPGKCFTLLHEAIDWCESRVDDEDQEAG